MNTPITIETIARQCHESNRVFCQIIGDMSQHPWQIAPEWQRQSAISGVLAHITSGLTMTPEESHKSWMAQKESEGWIYGTEKDPDAKTHPCMGPYHLLPAHQQIKDHIFRAIVHAMAPFLSKEEAA